MPLSSVCVDTLFFEPPRLHFIRQGVRHAVSKQARDEFGIHGSMPSTDTCMNFSVAITSNDSPPMTGKHKALGHGKFQLKTGFNLFELDLPLALSAFHLSQ